jgi:hypothetical protein
MALDNGDKSLRRGIRTECSAETTVVGAVNKDGKVARPFQTVDIGTQGDTIAHLDRYASFYGT